jgi:hydrogenase small subunit
MADPNGGPAIGRAEAATRTGYMPRFALDKGPITEVHAFWLAGMSCDGCSIAAVGAQNPSVEQLLTAAIPGLPKVILHHPVLSVTAGREFMKAYHLAKDGKLGAPYVVIYEGSVPDETVAGAFGGFWSGMGAEVREDGTKQPIPTARWLKDLGPGAAAVIAIGTCATWGGVPAAAGNVTHSMGVMDHLGKGYLSALGLPPINIPGCSPVGDNFTETVAALLMFLVGAGPLPEFDELGRPAWMFKSTVHRGCVRGGNYEEGKFASEYGDPECLVELGCWGPVVQCNIVTRGALGHLGGCMNTGGICIGCTMPGFPDAFAPFYKRPPGTMLSATMSRSAGSFISYMRQFTQRTRNLTPKWHKTGEIPSGWALVDGRGTLVERTVDFFYERIKRMGTAFAPGSDRQKALQASCHSYIRQRPNDGREAAAK